MDVMIRAAEEVEKGSSVRATAMKYGVDRMTLRRFILKKKEPTPSTSKEMVGYRNLAENKVVIPSEMEKDLSSHIKKLADMFHGLTVSKCCILAFQFAQSNNLKMPDNWIKNGRAGVDWWLGFKKRHHLAVRKPEATSFSRATAFNRPVVGMFYNNLAAVMDSFKFAPSDIFNCDETGCTTVQHPKEVVTSQGRKQVGSLTSGERGELVTVVYTVSADGHALPPMFIFPRVNYKDHFIRGAPAGSIGKTTRSGWIDCSIFVEYIRHIIKYTRCTPEHKILLILDNHESHISIQAIDLAKENGIVMLTIPPHTSHRLQPLDCAVYGPFKAAYDRAMDGWLRSNPGKTVTIYEIPTIVSEAHLSAMTPRNITAGFKSTGIHPFNRDLFAEGDFAPSEIYRQARSII